MIMAKRGWGCFFTALLAMCVAANTLQEVALWHVALQHFHGVNVEFYSGQISDYLLCFAPSQAYMLVYTIDSRDALSSLNPVTREIAKGTLFLLLAVPMVFPLRRLLSAVQNRAGLLTSILLYIAISAVAFVILTWLTFRI
jgi:hypothetical protein